MPFLSSEVIVQGISPGMPPLWTSLQSLLKQRIDHLNIFVVICAIAFLFKKIFIIKCIFLNYLLLELLLLTLSVHEYNNGPFLFLLKAISTFTVPIYCSCVIFKVGRHVGGLNLFPFFFFPYANFYSLGFFKTHCILFLILTVYVNFC